MPVKQVKKVIPYFWYCDSFSDCEPYVWLTSMSVQMYPLDMFGLRGYVWPFTGPPPT